MTYLVEHNSAEDLSAAPQDFAIDESLRAISVKPNMLAGQRNQAHAATPKNAHQAKIAERQREFRAFRQKTDITQRDVISGLLTCDGFMRQYREAFCYRSDTQGPLHADERGMLVLFDINDFDLIKNVYGAVVAQNCLREVGDILGQFLDVEKDDHKCHRYAGRLRADQFALLMRDVPLGKALEALHDLSSALNGVSVKAGTTKIDLKINLGLKPYLPGDTAEAILAGADLYKTTMIEEDLQMKADALRSKLPKRNRGNQEVRHTQP